MSWLNARWTVEMGCLALLKLGGVSKRSRSPCEFAPLSSTGQLLVPEHGFALYRDHARVQYVLSPQLRHHPQVAPGQFCATLGR